MEFQVREENLDLTACKDQRGSQEHLDQMGQRVVLVRLEPLGTLVLRVFRECQEREGFQDLPGPKVTEARLVRKDQRERLETMVPGDFLVQSAHKDPMGPVEKRANQDPKAHTDHQDQEECLEQEATLALSVLLDLLEYLVLMVSQESRGSLASLVRRVMLGLRDHRAWLGPTGLPALVEWQDSRAAEEPRERPALLVSLDLQAELAHQDPRDLWVNPARSAFQGKRAPLVSVETTDPPEDKERGDQPAPPEAWETRETRGRTGPRVPTALRVRQERQDREALWVFLVRGESVGCWDFQDQRVLQGSRELQDHRGTKAPPDPSVLREQTALVATLVLMDLLDRMGHQARMGFRV